MTLEEEIIFFNKELADIIRDLVRYNPVTLEDAIFCLKDSNNINRDTLIMRKLSRAGVPRRQIMTIIIILNN